MDAPESTSPAQTPGASSDVGTTPSVETPEAPANPAAMPLGSALFDESLKTHQGLAKFKDVDALAKSYVELDSMRRERSGVKPLTPESTPEEVTAYRAAMGIPEKPEGYELGELDFPKGRPQQRRRLAALRGWPMSST